MKRTQYHLQGQILSKNCGSHCRPRGEKSSSFNKAANIASGGHSKSENALTVHLAFIIGIYSLILGKNNSSARRRILNLALTSLERMV